MRYITGAGGQTLQVAFVKYDYIDAAVIGSAFLGIVAGDGDCVGETGYLETAFVDAYGGKVAQYRAGTFDRQLPVVFPGA